MLTACTKNKRNITDFQQLKINIIKGNITSYEELSTKYFESNYLDMLPYSLMMANKYHYPRAYYDVYEILMVSGGCVEDHNLNCLDDLTKELALDYLKLAIEKSDKTASEIFLEYYNKGKSYPIKEFYENEALVEKAKINMKK